MTFSVFSFSSSIPTEKSQKIFLLSRKIFCIRKPSCTAWASAKFYCESKTGNPEQTISLHLARSGSQSQRGIWFILPTHGASHITAKYYFQWSPRVACPTSLARRVHFDFSLIFRRNMRRTSCDVKNQSNMMFSRLSVDERNRNCSMTSLIRLLLLFTFLRTMVGKTGIRQ